MEKTTSAKSRILFRREERRDSIRSALQNAAFGAAALLFSRAVLFNNLSPFGLAFAAAAPKKNRAAAAAGAALGYLLTFSGTATVRYMACVAGVALINFIIDRVGQSHKSLWLTPVCAALCCASTGFAVLLAQGFSLNGALAFLCDCAIAGGMSYFFSQALGALRSAQGAVTASRRLIICCVICASAALMSLADISFLNFNPARMAGAFLIMVFAYLLREAGGAFAGICAGTAVGAVCGYIPLGGLFSAAGLIGGIFYPLGQLGIAAAFVGVCGLHAIVTPTAQGIAVIAESACAALLFVLLPAARLDRLRKKISSVGVPLTSQAVQKKASERLRSAQSAVQDVASCVESVSQGLSKIDADDPALIKARVRQSVCTGCPQSPGCSAQDGELRGREFDRIMTVLRQEGQVVPGDFDPDFQKLCRRQTRLAQSFNRIFAESAAGVCAGSKSRQLRKVVSDQFCSMAEILGEIAEQLEAGPVLLRSQSDAARDILSCFCREVSVCECLQDPHSKRSLHVRASAVLQGADMAAMVAQLRRGLGIRLSFPAVSDVKDGVSLVFEEKPSYRFDLGAVQRCSGEEALCGDYFECFTADDGSNMIVISDGMGTGARAAVDSAMAANLFSTLARAGLSCETALKITNSALLAKSEEETLSTLDVARIDPYSGQVNFYKAGAAPCFVRKGSRTASLERRSLPAGILREISFSTAQATLSSGDILLMLSDGALAGDDEWIHKLLRSWRAGAQELAEQVCARAGKLREQARADDITVVCVIVEKI